MLLATVFALAAGAKLISRSAFEAVLRSLVPAPLVRPLSLLVPLMELFLSGWLLSGFAARAACGFAGAMLALFSLLLFHMWRRRLGGCGCFGEGADTQTAVPGIVRNTLLILAALLVISEPPLWANRSPSIILAEMTVVVGLVCAWVVAVAVVTRWKFVNGSDASS